MIVAELSPEIDARSRVIWDELVSRIDGPLPFVRIDPNNPQTITSLWDVTTSGNQLEDIQRGVMYAELFILRAKNWRGAGDPFRAVSDVMMAIARKGNPGALEWGFFSRIAMLALAASLN